MSFRKIISQLIYFRWHFRKKSKRNFIEQEDINNTDQAITLHDNQLISFPRIDKTNFAQIDDFIALTLKTTKVSYQVFDNAILTGVLAIGITSKNQVILPTGISNNWKKIDSGGPLYLNNFFLFKTKREVDIAISLVQLYNVNRSNYFHWIYDSVLSLEAWFHFKEKTGKVPYVIIPSNLDITYRKYLSLLEIPTEKIIEWKYKKVKVDKLIVHSIPRTKYKSYSVINQSSVDWLKKKLTVKINSLNLDLKPEARIFISRQSARGRKVINYDPFEIFLKQNDFKIIQLEKLSLEHQLFYFMNAQTIIATHGAGLANLFIADKPNLIELIGGLTPVYSDFYRLCVQSGGKHTMIQCDYDTSMYPSNDMLNYKENDIIVDISEIENILQHL